MKTYFHRQKSKGSKSSSSPFFHKSTQLENSIQKSKQDQPFFNNVNIQTKLSIGQPNDKYEQEADAMADEVMQMPNDNLNLQMKCSDCQEKEKVQKSEMEEEEETLQTKSNGKSEASPQLSSQLQSSKNGGSQMSPSTNQSMSNAFGTDFSEVKIHTNSTAIQMNKGLNSRAFTHGKDIYFNQNEYRPNSSEGKRLLAHELTHVVQQKAAPKMIQKDEKDKGSTKKSLEKKYNIEILKGDKEWSDEDLKLLKSALEKFAKGESKFIRNYKFIRWSSSGVAADNDPHYKSSGDECGLHQAFLGPNTDIFKIHMTDECFKAKNAESHKKFGVDIGLFHLVHEIGHAGELAEQRWMYEKQAQLSDEYNKLIKAPKQDRKKIKEVGKKLDKIDKWIDDFEAGKAGIMLEFKKLIKDKDALTDYSKTDAAEAFAEAYAIFKVAPEKLEKKNKKLYDWFKANKHLGNATGWK